MVELASLIGLDWSVSSRPASTPAAPRVGVSLAPDTSDQVHVGREAALLSTLHGHLDQVAEVVGLVRESSRGDMAQADPERVRKLFPPYPPAVQERALYLDRLVGLGKVNDALRPSALLRDRSPEEIEGLARNVAARLATMPKVGVSGGKPATLGIHMEGVA